MNHRPVREPALKGDTSMGEHRLLYALFGLFCCLAVPGSGGAAGADVARSVVTTGIEGHEPVDRLDTVPLAVEEVYYFTELHGMEGDRVVHRWEYRGEMMAEVAFDVGGDRWRVWSSKRLIPKWRGEWRALLLDAEGAVLAEERFRYAGPAGTPAPGGDK